MPKIHADGVQAAMIAAPVLAFLILFAWAAYKLWDEPIRGMLRKAARTQGA